MKRWLMLFTAVLVILLVSGCKQDTSDDNSYSGWGGNGSISGGLTGGSGGAPGETIDPSITFVEGWWQCDFQAGNYMWVKYNTEKIGIKCLTKASNMAEVADATSALQSGVFFYTWDTMKKFAHDSNAKRFVHIEEYEVPNVGSSGSGTGGGGSGGGGSGGGSGAGGSDETNPAAVAGWYKVYWAVPPNTILYLLYNGSGKLQRIGIAARETSISTITSDYGEYANSLKAYDSQNPFLKNGKITNPAQWPSWAK